MKKVISFFITIIIFFLVFVLCISYGIKKTIINTLSKSVVQKEILSNVIDSYNRIIPSSDSDELNKLRTNIVNSKEINKITEKYFDSIVDLIVNNNDNSLPDIKDEIKAIIDNNKNIIKNNTYLSDSEIDLIVNYALNEKTTNKIYKNITSKLKNSLNDNEVKIINAYSFIISNSFKYIVIALIIANILFLILIQKSYYKWLFNLTISCAINGIVLSFVLPLLSNMVSKLLSNKIENIAIDINFNSISKTGYICFLICALSTIIYLIISNIKRKKNLRINENID